MSDFPPHRATYARLGASIVSFPHVAGMTNNGYYVEVALENGKAFMMRSSHSDEKKAYQECQNLLAAWEEYLNVF